MRRGDGVGWREGGWGVGQTNCSPRVKRSFTLMLPVQESRCVLRSTKMVLRSVPYLKPHPTRAFNRDTSCACTQREVRGVHGHVQCMNTKRLGSLCVRLRGQGTENEGIEGIRGATSGPCLVFKERDKLCDA